LTSPDSRRSFGSSNSCRVAKANTAMPPVPYKLYWYGSGGEILAETDSSGTNGEIQVLTQKRGKIAIIPLSTELKIALEEAYSKRKPRPDDLVLLNPENGEPFVSRKRLYERCKALGSRAGIKRVTPHCFRDTFACDMLARGVDIYDLAKMLADTVDTVEKHYAQFVPAARDAVQSRMDTGVGIEERAKLAQTRGQKVAVFPARGR